MHSFSTIIVSAQNVQAARAAAAPFLGGDGMLTTALSATGVEPATHYIASGLIPTEIVAALTMCDVSGLAPAEAMTKAALKLCAPVSPVIS